jgi:hypothetical protein
VKTFPFRHPGPLVVGTYLQGSPRWTAGADLLQARLTCVCGDAEPTTLTLEADGDLTSVKVVIQPSVEGEEINTVFNLAYRAGPGVEIRWVVTDGPGDVTRLALTLVAADVGVSIRPTEEMWVRWVNGPEVLRLYDYTPATHQFTEHTAGLAASRAALVNTAEFGASIQGDDALRVTSGGVLQMNLLYCNGGTGALERVPRLEFMAGTRRLASLTKTGTLYVPDYTEESTVDGGSDRFELYGGSALSAVLGGPRVNLRGTQLEEPL